MTDAPQFARAPSAHTPGNAHAGERRTRTAPRSNAAAFSICAVLLTVVALWPIWAVRFLPMQDYPQHLFVSHILSTFHDPALDWKSHYEVDLGLRPYMLWYVLMLPLARAFGTEAAGKLTFSLYILLVTVLVFGAARRRSAPAWGALLLYPFAFNQIYFMGFSNYVLSLPILFIAILDLEDLAQRGASVRRCVRHGAYLAILFLNHPYTVLVYGGLTVAIALAAWRRREEFRRAIMPAVALAAVFVVWYVAQPGLRNRATAPWALRWWPFPGPLEYYGLMFTGLRWTPGPDLLTACVWGGVTVLFAEALWRYRPSPEMLRWPLVAFAASLLGFCVLPFWFGYWSYFNLRLAPVSYFALALALGRVRLSRRRGMVVAVFATILTVFSVRLQARVSEEVGEVLPVVQAMRPNALVLPLVFDSAPRALDPVFFYEFHAHEPAYYHVIAGGGASPDPNFFPNALMPVHYRSDFRPPAPTDPGEFSWTTYGTHYDYIITRAAPPGLVRYLADYCDVVAQSGAWMLFRNRAAALPFSPVASSPRLQPRS